MKARLGEWLWSVMGWLWTIEFEPRAFDDWVDHTMRAFLNPEQPPTLCHFTNFAGLVGILRSRELWAVDFEHQRKDPDEFRHAAPALTSLLREMSARSAFSGEVRSWLKEAAEKYADASVAKRGQHQIFLTCFCADVGNPALWRGDFAGNCTGFALEFTVLSEDHFEIPDVASSRAPVEYDAGALRRRAEEVFGKLIERFEVLRALNPTSEGHIRRSTVAAAHFMAATMACTFKPDKFKNEREWRQLVYRRVTSPYVVYENPRRVCMPLRANRTDHPVVKIHVGSRAPADAEERIRALLAEEDYPPIEIVRSTVQPE
jgi:hypothetical protein